MPVFTPFSESDLPLSIIHEYRIGTKSKVIYVSVIFSIIITLTSLPFISIPISVKAVGVFHVSAVRFDLVIPVNGRIVKILMKDNQKITKGDTLLVLDGFLPTNQADLIEDRVQLLRQFLTDIDCLLKYSENFETQKKKISLQSDYYLSSLKQFLQEIEELKQTIAHRERIFKRYDYLYRGGVLTLAEYENFKFDHDQAVSNGLVRTKQFRLQLERDAAVYQEEIRKLNGELAGFRLEQKLYTIISNYNGSIQNIKFLEVGSYAFANQNVAEISPDGELRAYCYMSPVDIGKIEIGQSVSFQVDAFNYTTWGFLSGKVLEISDDVFILNGNLPVFKVQCSLDKKYFDRAPTKSYLKKGMSFTARFHIGDRNLLQLLRDKADNQINPTSKIKG